MMDESVPVGGVVAVSYVERDSNQVSPGLRLSRHECIWCAPIVDGSLPVGTAVAVSCAGGRQQSSLFGSAPLMA